MPAPLRLALLLLLTLVAAPPLAAQRPEAVERDIERVEHRLERLERGLERLIERIDELDRDDFDDELRALHHDVRRTERALRRVTRRLERDFPEERVAEWEDEIDEALDEMREALDEVRDGFDEALDDIEDAEDEWEDARDDEERADEQSWDWEWEGDDEHDDGRDDPDRDDWEWDWDDDWPPRAFDRHTDLATFVGDFSYRWPYPETALYRPIPAVRYNSVEGLVLGVGARPLEWGEYRRSKVVGQLGYAFALDEWRYDVGVETRLRDGDYAAKIGVLYRRNTATEDLWKTSWIENSLAAVLFNNDFLDYYQVEGWSFYAVQRLTRHAQMSAGFRTEEHRALDVNTGYALFGEGDDFAPNPLADQGRHLAFVASLEGGEVASLRYLPRGLAYRLEAEIADGLGGDFAFNRFVGDVRGYLPLSPDASLGLRLRGGLATGEVPVQKTFTLGGLGSVRGYPQNTFVGTRTLLANAELVVEQVALLPDLLDDVLLIGFFDAGWTGFEDAAFDFDDVYPAAGVGLGFDDRAVRLELAFPLREGPFGDRNPALWLRLHPAF